MLHPIFRENHSYFRNIDDFAASQSTTEYVEEKFVGADWGQRTGMHPSFAIPTSFNFDFQAPAEGFCQFEQKEIEKHLQDNKIVGVEPNLTRDNPMVKFNLVDKDGDPHEIVVRIVQIPDKF